MAEYRFNKEIEALANEAISEQAAFDTEEEAVEDAKKKVAKDPVYQIWQGEGKYVVSAPEAWEWLLRKGYKMIHDTKELMNEGTIEEV